MQRVLKLFSKYSLLDLKKGVWNEPDSVFILYPSILAVLESKAVEKLAEWILDDSALIGFEEGGDDDESFNADEID